MTMSGCPVDGRRARCRAAAMAARPMRARYFAYFRREPTPRRAASWRQSLRLGDRHGRAIGAMHRGDDDRSSTPARDRRGAAPAGVADRGLRLRRPTSASRSGSWCRSQLVLAVDCAVRLAGASAHVASACLPRIAVRLGFLFLAIASAGPGRHRREAADRARRARWSRAARPVQLSGRWAGASEYASLPSGHATDAFAAAIGDRRAVAADCGRSCGPMPSSSR